jgi:general secretion pathway protein G
MIQKPLCLLFQLYMFCHSMAEKRKEQSGLTLLELMIVVAIIAVLGAIGIPYYRDYVANSQYTVVIENLHIIEREARGFNILNGRYPNSLSEIGLGNLKDPWGNFYQYVSVATVTGTGKLRKDHNNVPVNTDFDLYSMGPDGKSSSPFTSQNSRDDIVRANNGGYFGRVSDY